jgi:hypothetical protein
MGDFKNGVIHNVCANFAWELGITGAFLWQRRKKPSEKDLFLHFFLYLVE